MFQILSDLWTVFATLTICQFCARKLEASQEKFSTWIVKIFHDAGELYKRVTFGQIFGHYLWSFCCCLWKLEVLQEKLRSWILKKGEEQEYCNMGLLKKEEDHQRDNISKTKSVDSFVLSNLTYILWAFFDCFLLNSL